MCASNCFVLASFEWQSTRVVSMPVPGILHISPVFVNGAPFSLVVSFGVDRGQGVLIMSSETSTQQCNVLNAAMHAWAPLKFFHMHTHICNASVFRSFAWLRHSLLSCLFFLRTQIRRMPFGISLRIQHGCVHCRYSCDAHAAVGRLPGGGFPMTLT